VCIVIALHQQVRITLEVAPVVLVHETGGRDPRPGGQRPHLGLLVIVQRPIDRQEFVVLVLAHYPSTQSTVVKRFARKLESSPSRQNTCPPIVSFSTSKAHPRPLTWSPSPIPPQVNPTPTRPSRSTGRQSNQPRTAMKPNWPVPSPANSMEPGSTRSMASRSH